LDDGRIVTRIWEAAHRHEDTSDLYHELSDPNYVHDGRHVLLHAAEHGDARGIEVLLGSGADVSAQDVLGNNALHVLAKMSDDRIPDTDVRRSAELLVDAGVSPLKKNSDGRTCAFVAAMVGSAEVISVLVGKKKNVDLACRDGDTPLHVACDRARFPAKTLFDHVLPEYQRTIDDPSVPEHAKQSAVEEYEHAKARTDDYFRTVRLLLEGGADPDRKNDRGRSPKDLALNCKDPRIAALLEGTYKEDEMQDRKGMTAVEAVLRRDHTALKSILGSGGDANEAYGREESMRGLDLNGKTPLAVACALLDEESVRILSEHGADPDLKGNDGMTPLANCLTTAGETNANDGVFERKVIESIVGSLKNHGSNINAEADATGRTVLNIAAGSIDSSKGYKNTSLAGRFVEVLLHSGANPNLADNRGITPLMHVSASGTTCSEDLQLLLLENGAIVSVRDSEGRTPLIYAAGNPKHSVGRAMAEMLFEFGDPHIDAVGNDGRTALDITADSGNEPLLNYLLGKL
jgi:ankyrin repeat protein